MKLISSMNDERIGAKNLLLEASAGEYLDIAKEILSNNDFQRRRVKSSPTIYSLLKDDLLRGCVIPPIVLAFGGEGAGGIAEGQEADYIKAHGKELLILDGLQRTSSMLELEVDLTSKGDSASLAKLRGHTLRLEVYAGINRLGILYRMLTLNTGHTPMSLRQQVEILFLDYARVPVGGIQLIREVEDARIDALGKYSFKAVIDGFNSYLDRNELPIDRYDLLDSVKSLEKLSRESQPNLFKDFIETYHKLVLKMDGLTDSLTYTSEMLGISGQPFGADARRILSKEQALAGFGAAVGKLKDYKLVNGFEDVSKSIEAFTDNGSAQDAVAALLGRLEAIRLSSKKIGNSQRLYFQFYFRELFNREGDGYRNIAEAVDIAYRKYESQTL